jgi:SAM-dependent methyltransferase
MSLRTVPLDTAAALSSLRGPVRFCADRVDLRVAADDGMETDDTHYLLAGASALSAIMSAVSLGGGSDPGSILDFGSGAGRVTRWLKAAYPEASLACCDLRPQDVEFCHEVFGAEAWLSCRDIEACEFRGPYDLIWMGSVLTHLSEAGSTRLIERAMAALNPKGLLVATTSGRSIRAVQDREKAYLQGDEWPTVQRGYDEAGYGYVDYPPYEGFEPGYGISLSSPAWVTKLATAVPGRRLVMISETAWDGTQDVFALQADESYLADPVVRNAQQREVDALRDRISDLETSRSWQVTAPLRSLATTLKGARRS